VYSNTDKKHNKEKTNQNQQFNNTKNSVVTNQVCVFQWPTEKFNENITQHLKCWMYKFYDIYSSFSLLIFYHA
jgi:hypothetical protein